MRWKYPIKRIVEQHIEQIRGWREGGAAWSEIAIALKEFHDAPLVGDSVRKAWLSVLSIKKNSQEFSRNLKKSEDKRAVTIAVPEISRETKTNEELLRNSKKFEESSTATPAPAMVSPNSHAVLPESPDRPAPPSEPTIAELERAKKESIEAANKTKFFVGY